MGKKVMNNPYIILDINQDATDEEIEKARKRELKSKCSIDQNAKDENDEYLSDVINQAADNLLNKERRREIDEKLDSIKNVPAIYSFSQPPSSIILTSISNEILKNKSKIDLKKIFFDKKVKCHSLYFGILSNNSCIFLKEEPDDEVDDEYYLCEYFTEKCVTTNYKNDECPWDNSKVFDVDGLLAFAYPAYQVIPNELIKNGKISDTALRTILPILEEVLRNNIDEFNKLFSEEQQEKKKKEKVHKK